MSEATQDTRRSADSIIPSRVWTLTALVILMGALAACSIKSSEIEILPWFKVRTTTTRFGSYSATQEHTFLARHFGFIWHKVDADGASILSDGAVLLNSAHGASILERGDFTAVPVCPLNRPVGVPDNDAFVDCLALGDYTGTVPGSGAMTVTRRRFDGSVVYEKTISVGDTLHRLQSWFPFFYDGNGALYLLAVGEQSLRDSEASPDCLLLTGFGQATRIAARRPDLTDLSACYKAEAWVDQVGPLTAGVPLPYALQLQEHGGHDRSGQ